ncbi:hypothetical protein [Kozakia baliensis]|uniref:Uncharacterized protein n=1 Tax=Kozakia baliensis TaxID=153496 RepID=A0A1D8UY71_9PROT|nr:hypothetical protein [Kozakia baliensis]AOX18579.1 hypothetical protein A0U89_14930 [Kozakia baliensis]AOX18613.1 hypothetical protein A0U89_14975 [Kozakia baliensis]AOX21471.1 hypothetical protein A0U90_13260 [Kozakia baliensis]AOX21643.1 hypothetical protein A0U90_14165 [Kozakia baliensis]GBR35241.1 hypothetical protein AA0488_2937 [Kozakia baliensis NRIC 0488]
MSAPLYLHLRSDVDMEDDDALDYGFTHRDPTTGQLLVLRTLRRRLGQEPYDGAAVTLPRP